MIGAMPRALRRTELWSWSKPCCELSANSRDTANSAFMRHGVVAAVGAMLRVVAVVGAILRALRRTELWSWPEPCCELCANARDTANLAFMQRGVVAVVGAMLGET